MTEQLIDTHCHIHSVGKDVEEHTAAKWSELNQSPEEVIERANKAGITKFICVGTDLADSIKAVQFAQTHDNCYAAVGIHPHEARHFIANNAYKKDFIELLKQPRVVAIGECGLDYFYSHSTPSDQSTILKFQLDLAIENNLPVIFHVREAFNDFWPLFNSYTDSLKGVLHSFTDTEETLVEAINRGLYIGVNGIATFAKANQGKMFKSIPLSNLLLETDAPYLTPAPYRGNINEPKYIVRVAEYMSDLKGVKIDELVKATTNNANLLFGI